MPNWTQTALRWNPKDDGEKAKVDAMFNFIDEKMKTPVLDISCKSWERCWLGNIYVALGGLNPLYEDEYCIRGWVDNIDKQAYAIGYYQAWRADISVFAEATLKFCPGVELEVLCAIDEGGWFNLTSVDNPEALCEIDEGEWIKLTSVDFEKKPVYEFIDVKHVRDKWLEVYKEDEA